MEYIKSLNKKRLLLILALIQIVSHLPYLKLPAVGNHVWRQCNTLAVARNYYEEDMNILYPRIDKRYNTNGITGPQFTSYDYSLAILYKLTGFSHSSHRVLSLFIGILAIWGIFFLLECYLNSQFLSFLGALALIGIPEFYYHSINAVPDLLALAFMIWGWFLYQKYLQKAHFLYALGTVFCLSVAGMTKIMYLMPGFVFLGDIWVNKRYKSGKVWKIGFMGLIILTFGLLWYYWAKILTSMNGIYEFVHEIRLIPGVGGKVSALMANLLSDVPETWVGYGFLGMFVIGAIKIVQQRRNDLRVILLLIGVTAFYMAMQYQLRVHGYYTLLFEPFVILVGIWGWNQLAENKWKSLLLWLLILSPVWGWARMKRNWEPNNWRVSHALIENQDKVKQLTQNSKKWIVGVDQSGCVDFYYLNAKGFPWYNLGEKADLFEKFRKDGAEGLITNDTLHAQEYFRELNWKPKHIGQVGEYHWYVF